MDLCDERLLPARAVLEAGLAANAYAVAVAMVRHRGRTLSPLVLGLAQRGEPTRPMDADTIFDLASLTKVLAGLSAVVLGLDRGVWALDDPIARFIPAFAAHGKARITLRHLLTHTTGLPAWAPLYLRASTPEEALPALCALQLEAAVGSRVLYSDLGFSLVGYLVQEAMGLSLPQLLARELFEPLGMRDTCYLPDEARRARCAATARGNAHEETQLAEQGLSFGGFRDRMLVGGVSGHAGLFGSAADLVRFAAMYLEEGSHAGRQLLGPASVRLATDLHTGSLAPGYGLGWLLAVQGQDAAAVAPSVPTPPSVPHRYAPASFMGSLVSPRAYGHTGFTGTSLLLDPARGLAVVLLTNAVHTDSVRDGIAGVRARFHEAVCAALR